MATEQEIINRLKEFFPKIGDDAEEFKSTPGFTPIISVDSFVEGVHFDPSFIGYEDIGYRCCAATLSDIAAMGGIPRVLLCSLGLKKGKIELVESIARGIKCLASKFNTEVIGGDTVKSDTLFLSLTVIGEVKRIVRRRGARVGDAICVTGPLGGSTAGLLALKKGFVSFQILIERYIHPEPRIDEGIILSEFATSMIDISDGLSVDLYHLIEESGVGAIIHNVPVMEEAKKIAEKLDKNPEDFALYGGEDFELLFTVDRKHLKEVKKRVDIIEIGKIVKKGMRFSNGEEIKLGGYDHFSVSDGVSRPFV